MTHASDASEKPRSARIDGSATPTIVTSKTIISSPRQTTSSASQRASCARAPPCAPRIPAPGPAVTFVAAPSRYGLRPVTPPLRARAGCAFTPVAPTALNRPEPGRGPGRGFPDSRAPPPFVGSLWPAARRQLRRQSGHVTACTVQPPALSLFLRAARCLLVVND